MGALEKKWVRDLKTSARNGDISTALADVLRMLRPTEPATIRHALAFEILSAISSLLCDKSVLPDQSVLDALCQIVSRCTMATGQFDDETQMHLFLCSLYHSIEVFLQKKMIKEALALRVHIINLKNRDAKLSEKISQAIRQISCLYKQEILDPLRETYSRNCDDESYFSLVNVLDDIVDLLMAGGIYNFHRTLSYLINISRRKATHVTQKSYSRFIAHSMKIVRLAGIFQTSSCNLVQSAPELCHDYLYVVYLVMFHTIKTDDFRLSNESLSELDHAAAFFNSNQNLGYCVKFFKHFSQAFNDILLDADGPAVIRRNFDLSFDALSSVAQQPDIDEVTFKVLVKICNFASRLIHLTCSKIRDRPCDWWNRRIDVNLLSSMNKVILEIDNVIDGYGHNECFAADKTACPMTSSSKFDVTLMMHVSKVILTSLEYKMKDIHLLMPQVEIVQKTCLKYVDSLKTLGCVQWKTQWISVAKVSYNLMHFCTKSDLKYHKNSILSDLLDAFLHLEDLANPALTCFDVWSCFTIMFESYVSLRKLPSALVTLVVALAAVPEKKKEIFQLWLTIKIDKHAKNIPDVSLWSIYNKEKANLHSKYRLDFEKHVVREEITVLELEALQFTSAAESPVSVSNCIVTLKKLELDATWRTRAEVALLKRTWTVHDSPRKDVLLLAKARLEEIPQVFSKVNREFGFILVDLAFWMFLCQLKANRNEMKAEMERVKEPRIPTQPGIMRRHTDDVIPTYNNLDIGNETNLLDLLTTAVTIAHGLVDGTAPEDFRGSPAVWDKLRNKVEVSARIFESFGYDQRALGCWGLLAKLATLTEDRPTVLLALGHLLSELDHKYADGLLQKGDQLAEELSTTDSKKETQDIVVSYHLGKSVGCLNNSRFAEGKQALKKALALLSSMPKDSILQAQAQLVKSKFKLLPTGSVDVDDLGDDSPHLCIMLALVTVKRLAKIRWTYTRECSIISARHPYSLGHNGQIMKVFCSVTLWYGQLSTRQGFTRHFERTTPGLLVSLQRDALALRTAQLLGVMANMDLACETPTCQVKINAMENVMLLRKSVGCLKMARKAREDAATASAQPQLVRSAAVKRDFLPSTPIFQPTPFTMPEFVKHKEACQCVYCKSPEIQTVALDIVSLQAQLYSLQEDGNQAVEFFKGATMLHSHLLKKQLSVFDDLSKTLVDHLPEALRLSLAKNSANKTALFRIKFRSDLSFADFHMQHDLVAKAVEMNKTLAAALEKFPLVHGFLYPEVLHQRVCCESRSKGAVMDNLLVPHCAEAARKSIGQVVAETPRRPTTIWRVKTAPRPFNVYTDRYGKAADTKARPPLPPAMSSAAILEELMKQGNEPDPEDFIESSPEAIPSTRRKVWTESGMAKKPCGLVPKTAGLTDIVSPVMQEARKKLLFNIEEETTQLDHDTTSNQKATKVDAPRKPGTAASKPRPVVGVKESLPDRHGKIDLKKVTVSRARTRIPKTATSTATAHAVCKTEPNNGTDDLLQVTGLLQKIKIEDDDAKKPSVSRRERAVPDAPVTSKKVLQPSGEVETKKTNKVGRPKAVRPSREQAIAAGTEDEACGPSNVPKKRTKAAVKCLPSVSQVTEMVNRIKVEDDTNDETAKPPARKARAAKPASTKPSYNLVCSSSSSSDSSKVKAKPENKFRSPLKGGRENMADVSSPIIIRRGRRPRL